VSITWVPRHGKSLICPGEPSEFTSTTFSQRLPNSDRNTCPSSAGGNLTVEVFDAS
jgi:hypothetical protein